MEGRIDAMFDHDLALAIWSLYTSEEIYHIILYGLCKQQVLGQVVGGEHLPNPEML
jgi:hypothetical protein